MGAPLGVGAAEPHKTRGNPKKKEGKEERETIPSRSGGHLERILGTPQAWPRGCKAWGIKRGANDQGLGALWL